MSSLLQLLRSAKPAELVEVRKLFGSMPDEPAPSRPEMEPAERRALGAELAAKYGQVVVKGSESHKTRRAELEAAVRESQAALERVDAERADAMNAYCAWRDPLMRRLWDERPAFVDQVLEELAAEAAGLKVESRTIMPEPDARLSLWAGKVKGVMLPDPSEPTVRTFSTGSFVETRRRALFELGELVKDWTAKGLFGTEAELQSMLVVERARLPRVPGLEELCA